MVFGFLFKKRDPQDQGILVGEVIHYFGKLKVAVIKVEKDKLSIGDEIRIKGFTTDFKEKVNSMQLEHETIETASRGEEAAIKVKKKVRRGDKVWKI
ncbi:MAG: hypothetical protein HQ594_06885 [Candidatus Omnitrophica bacterium]|nr:hypothetical protein [Candidatus Omnitrophota bacterium]